MKVAGKQRYCSVLDDQKGQEKAQESVREMKEVEDSLQEEDNQRFAECWVDNWASLLKVRAEDNQEKVVIVEEEDKNDRRYQ